MGFKGNETPGASGTEMNFIGKGTYVEGQIVSDGPIRIDGKVKGKVTTKNQLQVGPNGEINGEVQAKDAVVSGKVNGSLKIENRLELESRSYIQGDLQTKILVIDEGAVFHGNSLMDQNKVKPTPVIGDKKETAK